MLKISLYIYIYIYIFYIYVKFFADFVKGHLTLRCKKTFRLIYVNRYMYVLISFTQLFKKLWNCLPHIHFQVFLMSLFHFILKPSPPVFKTYAKFLLPYIKLAPTICIYYYLSIYVSIYWYIYIYIYTYSYIYL